MGNYLAWRFSIMPGGGLDMLRRAQQLKVAIADWHRAVTGLNAAIQHAALAMAQFADAVQPKR